MMNEANDNSAPAPAAAAPASDAVRSEDENVEKYTNKGTNCCREHCGCFGAKVADCKDWMDAKIKAQPFDRFRLGLRSCNAFMALLVLFCVLLGLITLGIDSYSAFILSCFLGVGGLVLFALEVICCCNGMETKLRHNLPFLFYARGRAWAFVLLAFLAFGMGVVPILVGVFCLLPYGLWSRYCIAIHPDCGDRMVTTQSKQDVEDLEKQGLTPFDHYVILDVEVEAQSMSGNGVARLCSVLNGESYANPGEVKVSKNVTAVPAHQEPNSALPGSALPGNDALTAQAIQYAIDHPDEAKKAGKAVAQVAQDNPELARQAVDTASQRV